MTTYPVELNVADRPVLIVGGGGVAARRADALVAAGARVRVVSPVFVLELQHRESIECVVASYAPEMIGPARLVLACTDDPQLNARIAADARAAGAWCNIADDPAGSDFLLPAILRRGGLTIAVGTAGASPTLAANIRDGLESQFAPDSGILVDELLRARGMVRERVSGPSVRRTINALLAGPRSIELLRNRGREVWREWFERLLANALATGRIPSADESAEDAGA